MVIDQTSQRFKKSLMLLLPLFIYGLCTAVIVWLTFLFFQDEEIVEPIGFTERSSVQVYDEIGKGALALACPSPSSLDLIAEKFLIISKNTRPDSGRQRSFVLLGLRDSLSRKSVLDGNTLFLEEKEEEISGRILLEFASGKSLIWVTPKIRADGGVELQIGKRTEEGVETLSVVARHEELLKGPFNPPFVLNLRGAVSHGSDHFIHYYGGKEFEDIVDREMVEVDGEIFYLGSGDYLTWVQNHWEKTTLNDAPSDQPLACVRSVKPTGLEIEVWDFTGFFSKRVSIPKLPQVEITAHLNSLLKEIRLRSTHAVTCLLGKQRLLLKEGDWVIKSGNGWRHLRTLEEIEGYLSRKNRGELFVIDEINEEALSCHLFNGMRTVSHFYKMPIAKEKRKK